MKLCAKFFFPLLENLFSEKEKLVVVAVFICDILWNVIIFAILYSFNILSTFPHFLFCCEQFSFSCIRKLIHTQTHYEADRLENAVNVCCCYCCCMEMCYHWSEALIKKNVYIHYLPLLLILVCCFCGMWTSVANNKPHINVFRRRRRCRRRLFLLHLSIDWPEMCMQKNSIQNARHIEYTMFGFIWHTFITLGVHWHQNIVCLCL